MLKNRLWAAAGLLLLLLWAPLPDAAAGVPHVTPEMQSADFWTNKLADPDAVIMSQREIAAFNRDIVRALPDLVYDLTEYPAYLSGEKLTELVNKRPFPADEDRYANGALVERTYYDYLLSQMNLDGIRAKNEVDCAVTVRRTNIRTFPTADESLEAPDDVEFDLFQETAVGPAEPVLILNRSLDGRWCFVQVYNYNGWMPAADLAVAADKDSWLEYVQPDQYLVVTGNRIELNYAPADQGVEQVGFTMGTRIPLAVRNIDDVVAAAGVYLVKLPTRGDHGELVLKMSTVPAGSDVMVGYMPYTRANIIVQAFKILGERYGWGGMFDARDCSAFVMDVYRSFGLMLPRNGDEQEQSAGRTVSFASLGTGQRYELLDSLLPGASLHTPTHEMLYLGEHEGLHYVIHDITSYGDPDWVNADGSLARVELNRVTVTDLSLTLRSGRTIIDSLTGGKQVESGAAAGGAPAAI
jgi:cell wall-associated NlpC family hydrolase